MSRVEVVLVRNGRGGANHLAQPRPDRRGRYTLACWRTCIPGRDGVVWREAAEIRRAFDLEWVCADCRDLARLRPAEFVRATGWSCPPN